VGPADRPYFREIMNKVRSWGYESDIDYAGELDPVQRVEFLAGLSVFTVPALYPEPIGLYVPEALAAGVPVIAPCAGCLPEWLGATRGGLLIEPNNPEALAAALTRLMRDKPFAAQMAAQGKDHILKNHDISQVADSILAVLTTVLKESRARK
jgi:glycosyltransferase involved in cell wall biosynthesis